MHAAYLGGFWVTCFYCRSKWVRFSLFTFVFLLEHILEKPLVVQGESVIEHVAGVIRVGVELVHLVLSIIWLFLKWRFGISSFDKNVFVLFSVFGVYWKHMVFYYVYFSLLWQSLASSDLKTLISIVKMAPYCCWVCE